LRFYKFKYFKFLFLISFFIITIINQPGYAALPVTIDDNFNTVNVCGQMEYFNSNQYLSFKTVKKKINGWSQINSNSVQFGYKGEEYFWFRFRVNNKTNRQMHSLMKIDNPLLDFIELYIPEKAGKYKKFITGDHLPYSSKNVKSRDFIFEFFINPGISCYYLMLKRKTSAVNFTAQLLTCFYFLTKNEEEITFYSMCFGGIILATLFGLFVFIQFGDISKLYFCLFSFAFIMFQIHVKGFGFQYLWSENIWLQNYSDSIYCSSMLIFFVLYIKYFFKTKFNFIKIDRLLNVTAIVPSFIFFILSLSSDKIIQLRTVRTFFLLYAFCMIYLILLYFTLLKQESALYKLVAFTILITYTITYILLNNAIIHLAVYPKLIIECSSLIMVILFGMGFSDKIIFKNKKLFLSNRYLKNSNTHIEKLNNELFRSQKKLLQRETEINDLNEKLEHRVEDRTKKLKLTNKYLTDSLDSLKKSQKRLVESEKMVALGSLVAGIAHEINTPVGIGVTAASYINDLTRDVEKNEKIRFNKTEFDDYVFTVKEASGSILHNLKRAAKLISSFKQVAVDQSSEGKRFFYLHEYINEVILSIGPSFKRTNHKIEIECPEHIFIESYPGAFSQIITNLVMNSLSHGFENKDEGVIKLKITNDNMNIFFLYSDNGCGMSEENLNKIFEPFFTTGRKKGGTGLGMNIVYNLITQKLGADIEVESSPDNGFSILIKLPYSDTPDQVN